MKRLANWTDVVVLALVAIALFFANTAFAKGQAKIINIVYTGRTWGKLEPCST
ncbi:hypothetical protein DBT_1096 [Dissulfuribacter thermophilus]|uniref:Uncharacterized protein n=1 Tax=Dissulfuribacter thermophilus TaxID=1156395 RepID=A0A1B9F5Y9_9BACT|nr:hypothetical protein [Dissulfuribacter thermophilus]OCC15349.1 hypothetical protein DBT_1096 [Dissulfuribacter thermophilus]